MHTEDVIYHKTVFLYKDYFVQQASALKSRDVCLTSLGANSLLISNQKTNLLLDPYFSRLGGMFGLNMLFSKVAPDKQRITGALDRFNIKDVTAILITHAHFDHALDAIAIGSRLQCPIYVPEGRKALPECISLVIFESMKIAAAENSENLTVSSINSEHLSLPVDLFQIMARQLNRFVSPFTYGWQYYANKTVNYLISTDKCRIMIIGSAGIPESVSELPEADFLILSIGGLDLKSRKYWNLLLEKVILPIKPKTIFLSHWDDFTIPLTEPVKWLFKVNIFVDFLISEYGKKLEIKLLPIGKKVMLKP